MVDGYTSSVTSKCNIAIVGGRDSHPERKVKLKKFCEILGPLSESLCVISGVDSKDLTEVDQSYTIDAEIHREGVRNILQFVYHQIILTKYILAAETDTAVLFRPHPLVCLFLYPTAVSTVRFNAGPSRDYLGYSLKDRLVWGLSHRLSDTIIVPSEACVEEFGLETYEQKIEYFTFHVRSDLEKSRDIRDRPFEIGYLGELSSLKGVNKLLEAIDLSSRDDVECKIGGIGDLKSEVEAHEAVSYAGWVDNSSIQEFYNDIQVFVLPSNTEGVPTVLLEAMACGTPILATRVGGIPDLIDVGETGYLTANSPNELAENIDTLLADDLERISENSVTKVREEYSREAKLNQMEAILYR